MKKKKAQENSGFSLVEILLAVVIFVLCVAPLLRAFILSTQTNANSRDVLNAVTLAENIMEEIKAAGVEEYGVTTGGSVLIDGRQFPIYEAKYVDYNYDGKSYMIEATMSPSTETYENDDADEKAFNSIDMPELYQMDRETDAIYVQGQDELWEIAKSYRETHLVSNTITVQDIVDQTESEYRFEIGLENEFYTVEQTITHVYNGEELQDVAMTMKIFDSVQSGEELKNLYVFFVPAKSTRIVIDNTLEVPLNIYLVKQGTGAAEINLAVNESSYPELVSKTRIRTNLAILDVIPEIKKVSRNGVEKTLNEAQTIFGLDTLTKSADASTRLYSVVVDVKDNAGNLLTTLTGTALK